MNLLERVLILLRANITTVVEQAEDPEKVLRQLQLDMHNQLVQVKTQVATAIAEGHKLRKRQEERNTEATGWLKKAEQAVLHDQDAVARAALAHYNEYNRQVERYQQQRKEQEQFIATMRGALRKLEAKLAEVDTSIDLLTTRRRNALLQQKVYDVLNKSGTPKEKEYTAKTQDDVLEAEARARTLADLHRRTLENQLEQLTEDQIIEQQLRDIKKKKRTPRSTRLLQEKSTQPAPLPPIPPTSEQPVGKLREKQTESLSAEPTTLKEVDLEQLRRLLETPHPPQQS